MHRTDIIDLSYAQPPESVDWPQVAAADVQGVIIRVGYGAAFDSQNQRIAQTHASGCRAQNLPFGVYLYFRPTQDPEQQAELLAQWHHNLGATFSPALDVEEGSGDLAPLVMRALLRVDQTLEDQRTILYTGPAFARQYFPGDTGAVFSNRALWLANYGVDTPAIPWPWDEVLLHQYAGNLIRDAAGHVIAQPGIVAGIKSEVDCNELGTGATLEHLRRGQQPCSPLNFSSVRDRQRALRRCGYDLGSLDGLWGARSMAALVLVCRDLGISEVRQWDATTEQAIAERLASVAPTDPSTC
jgi:GH25 family lysozyme M1 (1,4-beta-N-acetylmuramidase)